jgi:hypothetical protein
MCIPFRSVVAIHFGSKVQQVWDIISPLRRDQGADYQGDIVICGRAKELVALKFVHINRVWPRVSVPPATSDPDENSP